LKWPLILLVRFYRLAISPLLGPRCRYYPTCSEYALIALHHHGAVKGSWLALKRIARCHPGCEGGIDPVPGVPLPNYDSEQDGPEKKPDCQDEAHHHDDR
jgi:putative membrane protein insertion efficiency factor